MASPCKAVFQKGIVNMHTKETDLSEANERNRKIIEEFRANEGRVGGRFEGKTLLLLHSKGARSGKEHSNPAAYVRDNGNLVVIASKGGAPTHPDWYYNLLANPLVTVEVGTETFQARARIAEEPERTRLYKKMTEMLSSFADYEKNTSRVIPVFVLTPVQINLSAPL